MDSVEVTTVVCGRLSSITRAGVPVVAGSVVRRCNDCTQPIVVSPASRKLAGASGVYVCIECAPARYLADLATGEAVSFEQPTAGQIAELGSIGMAESEVGPLHELLQHVVKRGQS